MKKKNGYWIFKISVVFQVGDSPIAVYLGMVLFIVTLGILCQQDLSSSRSSQWRTSNTPLDGLMSLLSRNQPS